MNDSSIAAIVGFLIVVGLRVVDYFLPKGFYWRRIERWARRDEKSKEDNGE